MEIRPERLKGWRYECGPFISQLTGLVSDLMWLLAEYVVPLEHYWIEPRSNKQLNNKTFRSVRSPYSMDECNTIAFRVDLSKPDNAWYIGLVWPKSIHTRPTMMHPTMMHRSPSPNWLPMYDDDCAVVMSHYEDVYQISCQKTYDLILNNDYCRHQQPLPFRQNIVEVRRHGNDIRFTSFYCDNSFDSIAVTVPFPFKHAYPFMCINDPTAATISSVY